MVKSSNQAPTNSAESAAEEGPFRRILRPARRLFRWAGIALLAWLVLNILLKGLFLFWNPTVIVGLSLRAVRSSPAWQGTPAEIDGIIAAHEKMGMPDLDPYLSHHDRPFTSDHVNVSSTFHRRTVQNPPPRPGARRVFVFGGSTAWGYGVRDADTIPSRLQALLGPDYDVQNMSGLAWQSTQEIHHLLELLARGERPDLVVFYDGFNEKMSAVNNGGDPRCPMLWKGLDFSYRASWQKVLTRSPMGRMARTAAIRRAAKRQHDEFAGREADLSSRILANWQANCEMVRALGTRYGFHSCFFWQPDLFSNPPAKAYPHFERMKTSPHGIGSGGLLQAMAPLFAKALDGREAEGIFQIGGVLSGVEESVYLDFCHLNPRGNEIVATAIRDALVKTGALPGTIATASLRMTP